MLLKTVAQDCLDKKILCKPIVTKISAAAKFYVAEDYHKITTTKKKSKGIVVM
jgi:peptide methionine sulfoxide reductase MsrA